MEESERVETVSEGGERQRYQTSSRKEKTE